VGVVGKSVQENRITENIETLLKLPKAGYSGFHVTSLLQTHRSWLEVRAPEGRARPARSHSERMDNRWFLSGVLLKARLDVTLQEVDRNVAQTCFRPNQINQTKEIQSA
jgi:hypothetical protein